MSWLISKLFAQGGLDLSDTKHKTITQSGAWLTVNNSGSEVMEERLFTETTLTTSETRNYTASVTVLSGATVLDVGWRNGMLWAATSTCLMSAGDADTTNGYFTAVNVLSNPVSNVNGAGGLSSFNNIGSAGYGAYNGLTKRYPNGGTITFTVVSVNTAVATGVVAKGISRAYVRMTKPTVVNATSSA